MKELPDLSEKTKEPPFSSPYSVKARILIHAHLSRLSNLSPNLTKGSSIFIIRSYFKVLLEVLT
jgi:hypothetical protein